MEQFQGHAERLSRYAVYVGGGLLLFSAVIVGIEVVGRKMFNFSFRGVDEVSGYIFGIITAWAFSFALYRRAHVRIDALYVHLPHKVRCLLDITALASLAVVFSLLAHQSVQVFAESVRIGAEANTPLRTPLWIPQICWLSGLWFFLINIYILLVRTVWALLQGNFDLIRSIAAAPSLTEEVTEEIEQTREISRREKMAEGGDL